MELSNILRQQTTTPYALILGNASQWPMWISLVRSNAKTSDIWDLIDPSLEQEPLHTKPLLPKKVDIAGTDEQLRSDQYTDAIAQFHLDYKEYQRKRKTLIRTLAAIQISISETYLRYIVDKNSPWQALRALQKAIDPSYRMLTVSQQQLSNEQYQRARAWLRDETRSAELKPVI
ncbi:hypothetical protein JMJ35_000485 [Cladonia borealis]|uniref:Uncharacterized protein n=1 Tax=Cladonia borealis TaxID=184061 RepID=A0AA39R9H5_9LECA|nr:hypothetical protein JMJ35_000485 [Cladonia borealis]